ncbi:MAG: DUF2147 domain-containing protein [Saprospiraceae bacterium]|nr:DUF2147 domain-containing protein [Lewinella sp.]
MKQLILIIGALLFGVSLNGQNDQGKILGTWLNAMENARIEIFKRDDKYFGKVVWLANELNLDQLPESKLRKNATAPQPDEILGKEIISNLEYENGEWVNGTIYFAQIDDYVACKIRVSDEGEELYITLKKGWLSRTKTWTRI